MNTWQTIVESPMQPALQQLVQRLGWTLVHSIWQGLIIAAALAIALRLLRDAAATKRYAACCLAMMLTIAAGAATFYCCGEATLPPAPVVKAVQPPAMSESPIVSARPIAPTRIPPIDRRRIVLQSIVALWAIGVVAMAVQHIGGWLWLLRLRRGEPLVRYQPAMEQLAQRLGVTRIVRLIETSRIDVPAVIGFFRPVIFIPIGVLNDLTAPQVEAILAHELAHVRRNDYLVNLLQAVVETLMFYHPAVWWMSNRMRAEREHCCDDIAAEVCGDERLYASALAALEGLRGSKSSLAAAATGGGELLGRVRRVLHLPPAHKPRSVRSLAVAGLAIVCIVLPLAVIAQQRASSMPTTKRSATRAAGDDFEHTSPITPDDLISHPDTEAVAMQDLLQVSLTNLIKPGVDTVKSARVDKDGNISLPQLGAMKVVGLTPAEIEKAVITAYHDAHLLAGGTVSVTDVQRVGWTFSIIGNVTRPGQYQIVDADYRVLDALKSSAGNPQEIGRLVVIRKADKRLLEIPLKQLAAGDLSGNIVIRPGDMLIATAPVAAPSTRTTAPSADLPAEKQSGEYFMDGHVRRGGVYSLTGRKITLRQAVAAAGGVDDGFEKSQVQVIRRSGSAESKVIQNVSVDDVLQGRTEDVLLQPNDVVRVGNMPTSFPATQAIVGPPPERAQIGEFYMDGHVLRTGVYSLTGTTITLRQAIIAAGGVDAGFEKSHLDVIRRTGDAESTVVANVSIDDLLNGRTEDLFLKPNDVIRVGTGSVTGSDAPPATQQVILGPPPEGATGEYYVDGDVPRTGVYNMTGRKISIRQAIVAAGGLQGDAKLFAITVIRRIGKDQQAKPLDNLPANDLMEGRLADIYLWPNDVIRILKKGVPATTQAAVPLSIETIAALDATMREYIKRKDELEFRLAQLARNVGEGNIRYVDTKADLALQNQRIDLYAAEFRKHFVGVYLNGGTVTPLTQEMKSLLDARQAPAAIAPAATTTAPTTQSNFGVLPEESLRARRSVDAGLGVTRSAVVARRNLIELDLAKEQRSAFERQDRILGETLGSEHPKRIALRAAVKQLDEDIQELSRAATSRPDVAAATTLPADLVVLLRQQAMLRAGIANLANVGSENRLLINYQDQLGRISRRIAEFTAPSTAPTSDQ